MTNPAQTGDPYFHLVSCTENPVETLMAEWITSRPTQYEKFLEWNFERTGRRIPTALDVQNALRFSDREYQTAQEVKDLVGLTQEDVDEVFKKVIAMSIPVSECIHFTWGFTGMPISWREQAVRKRQWGFWLTSMREFSMSGYVDQERVDIPLHHREAYEDARTKRSLSEVGDSLAVLQTQADRLGEESSAGEFLYDLLQVMQWGYDELIKRGMTQEDARCIIPLSAKHNGSMFSNLRTLLDTTKSRSCWIAQVDLWAPVLTGMVRDLQKVHPLLAHIISPPCFDRYSDKYKGCAYELINENRMGTEDPFMPCPIYSSRESFQDLDFGTDVEKLWEHLVSQAPERESYLAAAKRHLPIWGQIWNRDPVTGRLNDE